MKITQLVFLFVLLAVNLKPIQAQSNDVSVWLKLNDEEKISSFVWGTYSHEDFFLDYRWNFDAENALSFYVGKTFISSSKDKSAELFLTPEIGVVYSHNDYVGVSPEILAAGHIGQVTFFNFTQYIQGLGENTSSFYQYNELGYILPLNIVFGGGGGVFYDFADNSSTITLGPYVFIPFSNNIYARSQLNLTEKIKFSSFLIATGYRF